MSLFQIYAKALSYLKTDKKNVFFICIVNIIFSGATIAEPVIFGHVIDVVAEKRDIVPILALWAVFGCFNILAVTLVSRGADRIAHARRASLLAESYEKMIQMPLVWHQERSASNLIHALIRSTEALFGLWLEFMRTHLVTLMALIFLIPTALSLDVRMSLVLFGLGVAYVSITRFVMYKTRHGQKSVEKHYHAVFEHVTDTVSNIPILQGYDRVRIEAERLCNHIRKLLAEQNPILDWWAIANALNRLSATLSMMIVLIIGSYLVVKNELPIGGLVTFTGFAGLLIAKLDQISGIVSQIFDARAKLEDFYYMEKEFIKENDAHDSKNLIELENVKGDVEFQDVCFSFSGSKQIIKNISFEVKQGQTVAIVGPAGSGKTTLINLLQRIYKPDSGKILIDSVNIADISLRSLRRTLATVFQQTGLFNRSIEENIRIGNESALDCDVFKAAEIAFAHDFVQSKELGYQSKVGDQGSRLSGGERQRLAIARAVLKNAPIFLLDEATSALDVETEEKIKDSMQYLRHNHTLFIIAHRLTTIRDADLVLFIEKGCLVEKGTFHELSACGGRFSKFLELSGLLEEKEIKKNRMPSV